MSRIDRRGLDRPADLVRWGPVVSGVVIGLGLFALLNSLWIAIAYGSSEGWVGDNLTWFAGASAAVALLVAGFVAGMLAGVRGMLAGLANGLTAWGLLFALSLTAIFPGTVDLSRLGTGTVGDSLGGPGGGIGAETALWTGFWSMLVGLVLAGFGGVVGAAMRFPVVLAPRQVHEDRDSDDDELPVTTRSTAAAVDPAPAPGTTPHDSSDRLRDRR